MDAAQREAYLNAYYAQMRRRGRPALYSTLTRTTAATVTTAPAAVKSPDLPYPSTYSQLHPFWQHTLDYAALGFRWVLVPLISFRIFKFFCEEGYLGEWGEDFVEGLDLIGLPDIHLQPNHASRWLNALILIVLFIRYPIQTTKLVASHVWNWIVQKYYQLRYNQFVTNIEHWYWIITLWIGQNAKWILLAMCIIPNLWLYARTEYHKYRESRRLVPWYDHRTVRNDPMEPELIRFDEDVLTTAMRQNAPWNAIEETATRAYTAKSFDTEDSVPWTDPPNFGTDEISVELTAWDESVSHSRPSGILTRKFNTDSLTSEDIAPWVAPPEVSIPVLTTTRGTRLWKPETVRPASLSITTIRETVLGPSPKHPSRPPITSVEEKFDEEEFERKWQEAKPKQTIQEGRWEPWKEDMAKNPNQRRQVGKGLTWCLACKQYHCCELPY